MLELKDDGTGGLTQLFKKRKNLVLNIINFIYLKFLMRVNVIGCISQVYYFCDLHYYFFFFCK